MNAQSQETQKELKMVQEILSEKNEEIETYATSNIRLSQFAYLVSHDLKSSLNTIKSFTGLLKSKIADKLEGKEKEYFDYIEKAAITSEALVLDTFYYSQVKVTSVKLKQISVEPVIQGAILSLDDIIRTKEADIEVGTLPKIITADKKQLRTVFEHIIANALKFIPIERSPKIVIKVKEQAKDWVFEVTDNGIGISPENQEKIFREFVVLNNRYEYLGTGFGLSICKKIIEKHGGNIWVADSSKNGSTVAFTIDK